MAFMDLLRNNHRKTLLCAELSKFAYTSANPSASISADDDEARRALRKTLNALGYDPQNDYFERFNSKSWHKRFETQKRWFRSQSFFYRYYDSRDDINRIVVAFRGTWNDKSAEREWHVTKGMSLPQVESILITGDTDSTARWYQRWTSGVYNFFMRSFPPSNLGLSDFYYDAFLIRTPSTEGTVWKWYAYWGSLVLQRTHHPLLSKMFSHSRLVAADWLSRPDKDRIRDADKGDVHLGFWSLWASPEGFAGYKAQPSGTNARSTLIASPRILSRVREAVGQDGKTTKIMVVGHSLGGAVSR